MNRLLSAALLFLGSGALPGAAEAAGKVRAKAAVETPSLAGFSPTASPAPESVLAAPALSPSLSALAPAAAAHAPAAAAHAPAAAVRAPVAAAEPAPVSERPVRPASLLAQLGSDAKSYGRSLDPAAGAGAPEKAGEVGRARFDGGLSAPSAPERPSAGPVPAAARPSGLARWGRKAAGLFTAPLGILRRPRSNLNWSPDNAVPPYAEFAGDKVVVRNVRDFTYRSPTDYTPAYYDATYDLRQLEKVWFAVEPLGSGLIAHTFLTFDFKDGRHLSISVEVRKEVGESFSAWKGLFNAFELAYVVGDESDVIGLRVNHRRNPVHLYPVKAAPEKVRALFTDMLVRATSLRDKPEFYNSVTNTCLSNILRHLRRVSERRFGFSPRTLFPGLSDRLAYDMGLIDTGLSFAEAKRAFRINERAADERASDFSARIRAR